MTSPLVPGHGPMEMHQSTSLAVSNTRLARRGIPDDLALFPPGTTVHEGRLRCGLTLRWYERGPKDAPCALLLHGYPEIAISWRHQVRALSEHHRVVAVDMRGCGASEGPFWFWHYTLGRLATDTVELMEVLGVDKVHLVGHDWGAAVAWEAAARFPESFTSLSIINCPPLAFVYRNAQRQVVRSSYSLRALIPFWLRHRLRRHASEDLRQTFHIDEDHKRVFTDEMIEAYARHARRGQIAINYYRAALLLPTLRLRPINGPTRLIWGLADPWMSPWFGAPENYRGFVREIDAVQLEGVGHFAQQQAPQAVNAAIATHWARIESDMDH